MLVLGIHYLCGYSMATDTASRVRAEWPPHPGRVFMALVAAHFETGREKGERDTLLHLESLGAPDAVYASPGYPRSAVTHYVPVNDSGISGKLRTKVDRNRSISAAELKSATSVLPERRPKQPRTFPRVWLRQPYVLLVWDAALSLAQQEALDALASKVTRIGHSASLVQMWAIDRLPERIAGQLVRYSLEEHLGEHRLRIPSEGICRPASRAKEWPRGKTQA